MNGQKSGMQIYLYYTSNQVRNLAIPSRPLGPSLSSYDLPLRHHIETNGDRRRGRIKLVANSPGWFSRADIVIFARSEGVVSKAKLRIGTLHWSSVRSCWLHLTISKDRALGRRKSAGNSQDPTVEKDDSALFRGERDRGALGI